MNKSTARVNSTSKSNNTITTQSSKPTTSSNATPSSTTWASKLKLPSSSTISDTSSTISSSTSTSIPPTPTHNNQTATTSTNTTTKPDQLSKQQPSKPIESTSQSRSTGTLSSPSTTTEPTTKQHSTQQSNLLHRLQPGCTVVLFTRLGERLSGIVYTYNSALHTLVIDYQSQYIILNTNTISIESIDNSTMHTYKPPNTTLSTDQLNQREQSAIQQRKQLSAHIGHNVTVDAQRLYDAINKTIKCAWNNQHIVVSDTVQIDAPTYNTVHVIKPDGQKALDRVKKILAGERVRLGIHS